MMDDPLAFFDININRFIIPVLEGASKVFTSTDNMIPVYNSINIDAELVVGLANPLFDVAKPVEESGMIYDWGFIGGLYPQRFRFFWELQQLIGDLNFYVVTEGLNTEQVIKRIRETRVNIVYGNFSDIPNFPSNGTTFRPWEFPYAGAFILHDYRPLLSKFFLPNSSIVIFNNVDECARLVRYYLNQPEKRYMIAKNARSVIQKYRMLEFLPNLYDKILS